jgi:hypothetical protein
MKIGIFETNRMISQLLLSIIVILSSSNCQNNSEMPLDTKNGPAKVENVTVSGTEGKYSFAVTLKSPDTGCDQYANWWEVISADGATLLYRRILAHSHVSEQPFTRSGGTVDIDASTEVIVRAHMHPGGYGEGKIAMIGSVANGFAAYEVDKEFGKDVEKADPQPNGCAF